MSFQKLNDGSSSGWLVSQNQTGLRLDACLHNMLPDFSRSLIQRAIKDGIVLLDGKESKPSYKLHGGEKITLTGEIANPPLEDLPQQLDMEFDIAYQDDDVLIINKPAGLVVHPGAGNRDKTMVNALLYHYPDLSTLPRAGLVHRLDKNTSGLIMVARNITSYNSLVELLQKREIKRRYTALCYGDIAEEIFIDKPIGRNTGNRIKMAVVSGGKPAQSTVKPLERFGSSTLILVSLHSGRTHQIRVHMHHIGHCLVGDPLYHNGRKDYPVFSRQALHATELEFIHPLSGKKILITSEQPDDMKQLIAEVKSK